MLNGLAVTFDHDHARRAHRALERSKRSPRDRSHNENDDHEQAFADHAYRIHEGRFERHACVAGISHEGSAACHHRRRDSVAGREAAGMGLVVHGSAHELALPADSTAATCAAAKGTTLGAWDCGRAGAREYWASTSALLPNAAMPPLACSTSILSMSASTLGRWAMMM